MASTIDPAGSDPSGLLLGRHDPPPVRISNPENASPFLLIGDHAGNRIPSALGDLGISAADLARHIGWDIGVEALGTRMSTMLDTAFVRQSYSRLVIDCNRDPSAPDAMPLISDGTPILANADLSDTDRTARISEIHEPYHAHIAAMMSARDNRQVDTVLVALHSFTPRMKGVTRPWDIGVLHDGGDPSFALRCLGLLRASGRWTVGDNEPYRMDQIDYTVPRHAYARLRPYVEIEVRQDLLATVSGIEEIAIALSVTLRGAR